jgi:hypothetical protein
MQKIFGAVSLTKGKSLSHRGRNIHFWTAPTERSGDGAFVRTGSARINENFCPRESGVALRFPPQSKTLARSTAMLPFYQASELFLRG